jgi:transcriptional regulator with XRE-family HTH domain
MTHSLNKLMKVRRKETGKTLAQAAKELGYNQTQQLWSIENCLCAVPERSYKKIAKVYNIPLEGIRMLLIDDFRNKVSKRLGLKSWT